MTYLRLFFFGAFLAGVFESFRFLERSLLGVFETRGLRSFLTLTGSSFLLSY